MTDRNFSVGSGAQLPVIDHYDYIIVGAGSAGCVVARRLAEEENAYVLLLEAGIGDEHINSIENPSLWPQNIGSALDYGYENSPSPRLNNRSTPAPTGKVIGGSGSINGMIWTRGSRTDFDRWALAGSQGWDYESVLPLFKRSEDWEGGETAFHGAGGPMHIETEKELHPLASAFIEAGRSLGMSYLADMNVPDPVGVGPMSMNIRNGKRFSTADGYLKPILYKNNLTVLTGASVLKLNFIGTRCIGLDFIKNSVKFSVTASKEIILSAGAVNTPRILLLSGIGNQEDLKDLGIKTLVHLPGVGANMQDHPMLRGLSFQAGETLGTTGNLSGSMYYWKSSSALSSPDLMGFPMQVPFLAPEPGSLYTAPENAFSMVPVLIRPKSRGYIKMKTALHDGPMEIQPNFLAEEEDMSALITAVEMTMDLVAEPAFKWIIKRTIAYSPLLTKMGIISFIRNACSSCFHSAGSCAMGITEDSVVNNRLQVNGIEGLRIADTSIMPSVTSAGTYASTIMIGEFASLLIHNGDYKKRFSEAPYVF